MSFWNKFFGGGSKPQTQPSKPQPQQPTAAPVPTSKPTISIEWSHIGNISDPPAGFEQLEGHASKEGELSAIILIEGQPKKWGSDRTPNESSYIKELTDAIKSNESAKDWADDCRKLRSAMTHGAIRVLLGTLPSGKRIAGVVLRPPPAQPSAPKTQDSQAQPTSSETRMPSTRIVLPDHPLFSACGVRGDMVEVQSLLKRGVNIRVVDQDGLTALHHSAVFGRVEISEALLKAGAVINERASDGSTPLFNAAKNGHVDEVAFLLSHGALMNAGCNDGGTPLIVASEYGHAEVVRRLLAAGADPNACMKNLVSPLYVASQNGHAGIVTQLLTAGSVVDSADDEGMTPMLVACGNSQEQVVGLLLAAKANPNAKDKYGNTPRSIATKYGRTNIIRLLQFSKPQPQQPADSPAPQPAISQAPPSPTSEASIHDRLMRMFGSHFQRMRAELQHRPTVEILTEVESRFHENSLAISAMVEETLSDRKLHTKCIGGDGTRVWLLVSAVPRDRHNSASFFGREYPPGYAGYMQFWLDSQPFKMAQRIGNDIFAHVLLYADVSASEPLSLGFGLFPLDQSRPDSTPKMIMPQESLTREDKAAMGL